MEITNAQGASQAGDISTGATDTTALGATSTGATVGYSPDPALGGDDAVTGGSATNEGADTPTTSSEYGTRLSDGVQTTGDARANNVESVDIKGSDVGANP